MSPVRVMHFRREVPTGGGPESLIVDIARQIDRSRFDMSVTVFGPASPSPPAATPLLTALAATGTPTHVLPAHHRFDLGPVRHLARLLEDERVDILHSHDHRSNLIAYLAVRRRPTIQVATLHQPMRRYWWLWHWEALDEWVWPHFNRVLPVADAIRQEILERHPRLQGRVVAVTNGVDLTRFRPGGRREEVRAEFNIPPGAILCVTIGRFLPDKGLPYLLEAARKVLDRRGDVYWLLAGRGPLEVELKARAIELGLSDHVIFAGFRSDVPDLVAASDLVVVSSTCEGCSVAILEAMACARAVVVTRVGGTPEIVEDGRTGLIVEPRRPDELATAVMELANDPGRREEMGRLGMGVARDRFSIQRMVSRYEHVYEELVGARLSANCCAGV
jgi:glycosyltransferase involved in cell wall biosynthesis